MGDIRDLIASYVISGGDKEEATKRYKNLRWRKDEKFLIGDDSDE
jgi:hypothetical protein